jgi:hypothetical protein
MKESAKTKLEQTILFQMLILKPNTCVSSDNFLDILVRCIFLSTCLHTSRLNKLTWIDFSQQVRRRFVKGGSASKRNGAFTLDALWLLGNMLLG